MSQFLGQLLSNRMSKYLNLLNVSTLKNNQHTIQNICFSGIRCSTSGASSGDRSQCSKQTMPKCSKENLAETKCMKDKKEKKDHVFKSMWYNPDCCIEVCANALPRFDELYYKISDKAKRKYPQTWNDCPEFKILPKKVCQFEKLKKHAKKFRDIKKDKPKTACPIDGPPCKIGDDGKCPRIGSKNCKPARYPPTCVHERAISNCKKVCAPYPSFSECDKPPRNKTRPVECLCLGNIRMCDMWAYLRKLDRIKT